MASTPSLLLLHLLLVVSAASQWSSVTYGTRDRFFGGSLTFNQKGNLSEGTYRVELRGRQTTSSCNVNSYSCSSGVCGSSIRRKTSVIFKHGWCQVGILSERRLTSNLPFEIRYPTSYSSQYGLGIWISNVKGTATLWRMMAHVDLGSRSDTGQSNRSPIAGTIPVLRVPKNCPRTFNIAVFDPDGDHVRCRMPTSSSTYECGLCGLTSAFSLDQNTCSLKYKANGKNGYHPVELVVEDFPNKKITLSYSDGSYTIKRPLSGGRSKRQKSTDTTKQFRKTIDPLSRLPLQFSVIVDSYSISSCLDGDYLPVFLPPTPVHGAILSAFVNHTLEIKVNAKAQYTTIYALLVTGPSGILQTKISTGEYVLKWTPTDGDVDGHFPICFAFLSRERNGRDYQSDLRCVIADVEHEETVVTCTKTAMMVEVRKSYLIRRNEDNLHLNVEKGSSCSLTKHSNKTHVVAVMALNACGTTVEEDEENILFMNKITSAEPGKVISRKHDVDIAFSCAYPKRTNLTLAFTHKNPYAFSERGFGAFTYQFEFFESQLFRKQVDASTYPVEVYLKQMMFMQIEATTSIPNTELFVESCRATPYDNPNSRTSYTIIEQGCVKDDTVKIYPSSKSQFRFGMESFEFIGAHEEVYITCSVLLCEAGIPGTRCSQGCIKSGKSRRKRDAVAETSSHFISQGPLRLAESSDSQESGFSLSLGTNLVLIVGVLLGCGVAIFHSRRVKATYQPLPTSDAE